MSIKTKQEILEQINARFGEDNSDEALSMIEDITDTLNDFETRANGDGIDWKSKYEENDKAWKKKYVDRFFNGSSDTDGKKEETHSTKETLKDVENENKNDEGELSYDGLFSGAEETNKANVC